MANAKISALTAATTPLAGTEVLPIVQSGATVKVANNDLRPKQIQSNATSGVLQIAGPTAGNTRVMTTPDANFTAARTDAGQTFTGNQQINGTLGVKSSGGIVTVESTVARGSGSNYIQFNDPSGNKGYVGYISGASDNMFLWNSVNAPVLIGVNGANTWTFDTSSNLVPATAAKGINFTANTPAAGMTSQLLNWYEEGTFTPTFFGTTTAGTPTYSAQKGAYTRIGRTVNFSIYLNISNKGGMAGNLQIGGLPFAASSNSYYTSCAVAELSGFTLAAGQTYLGAEPGGGSATTIVLYDSGAVGGSVQHTVANTANASYIVLSGFYFV